MATTYANDDVGDRTSKNTKNGIEVADLNEKNVVYRMSEAEIPLEQKKEEARVLSVEPQRPLCSSATNFGVDAR